MYFLFLYSEYHKELTQLPIAPGEITYKMGSKNKVIELMNIGDVNVLKDPALKEINFDILLPDKQLPFAVYLDNIFTEPRYFLDRFEKYKIEKVPVRFILSKLDVPKERVLDVEDVNMLVSLENFTIKEKGGAVGDVYVSLDLKQYKEYGTEIVSLQSVQGATKPTVKATVIENRPAKPPAKTYEVKKGDSLWAIAKKQLNNGDKYKDIAQLNNIKNPSLIYPGQILRLG